MNYQCSNATKVEPRRLKETKGHKGYGFLCATSLIIA